MNFDNTLFRCSSLGHLMTEPMSKSAKESGELSEGCKTHLIDVYVSNKYGRQTDISNKYIEKGLMVEEDSITLYSRVKKRFFKKNDLSLHNDFIKGTPDCFMGLEVSEAEEIIDLKSSWDIFTFFRVHTKPVNPIYYWQMQGYMALSGAKKATLCYCLVNTPEQLINDEKRRLLYKMNPDSNDYKEGCDELEKSMLFDDIQMNERIIEFSIERSDEDIKRLYEKIKKSRGYLNQLEARLMPVFLAEYKLNDKVTLVTEA